MSIRVCLVKKLAARRKKVTQTEEQTKIQAPHIREAFFAIAPPYNHHNTPNQVCSMIAPCTWFRTLCLHLLPAHRFRRAACTWCHIQSPHIIKSRQPIPSAKYPHFPSVTYSRMSASGCRTGTWSYVRPRPPTHCGVEDVHAIVVCRAESSATDYDSFVAKGGSVCSGGRRMIAYRVEMCPLHCFCR